MKKVVFGIKKVVFTMKKVVFGIKKVVFGIKKVVQKNLKNSLLTKEDRIKVIIYILYYIIRNVYRGYFL